MLSAYLKPSPLVVHTDTLTVDLIIHVLLYTVGSPLGALILAGLGYWRWMVVVQVCWLVRALNICLRRATSVYQKPKNLIVLVTGGSRGLGKEMVDRWVLKPQCEKVVVMDVVRPETESSKISFFQCDMSDLSNTRKILDEIYRQFGRIDVLVCNSGLRQRRGLNELNGDEIKDLFSVNYFSHVEIIKKALKAHSSPYRLHIVVVSSVLGFVSPRNLGVYSATKSSLLDLMDSLRHETDASVVLSTVAPGQLTTTMFEDVHVPNQFLAPLVDHRKLAGRICEIVESGSNGLFIFPFYGRFIPLLHCLPYWLYCFLRKYSSMDSV